jgi:hypothetical protein
MINAEAATQDQDETYHGAVSSLKAEGMSLQKILSTFKYAEM